MAGIIRLATEDDAEQVLAIYAPYVRSTPISFEIEPPTLAQMRQRILETLDRMPWLICENAGTVLGYVYASPHRARAAYQWSVDVAVYIDAAHHRAGVGRALYASLFSLLSLQGFYRAYAGITLPNAASVGLHEAIGFTPVGIYTAVGYKLGHWYDVGWWQRPLQSPSEAPSAPAALSTAQEAPEWSALLATGLPFLH